MSAFKRVSPKQWVAILAVILAAFTGQDIASWLAEVVNVAAVATLPAS